MRIHRSLPLLTLLPAALVAQQPEASFSQALRQALGDVQQLLKDYKPRQALTRIEAILPAEVPAWASDHTKPQEAYASYQAYREYIQAYGTAAEAASASGYWEKAVTYYTKARDLAKVNAEKAPEAFALLVTYYKNLAESTRRTLAENADYIQSLRTKANPDPGDLQQLELIKAEEASIEKNLNSAKYFEGLVETVKREAAYYASLQEQMSKQADNERENLATYKFKNDKVKWVEGIMSAKGYLEKAAPDKADRIRYLYRLNVLDPKNTKVIRLIKSETGTQVPPPTAQ